MNIYMKIPSCFSNMNYDIILSVGEMMKGEQSADTDIETTFGGSGYATAY